MAEPTSLRAAVLQLEREAYQHGLRNGVPPPHPGVVKGPVGGPHHEARVAAASLLDRAERIEVAARAILDRGGWGDDWDVGGWVVDEREIEALRAALDEERDDDA